MHIDAQLKVKTKYQKKVGVRVLVFELWVETFYCEVSENGPKINLDKERNQGKSGLNRTQLFFE